MGTARETKVRAVGVRREGTLGCLNALQLGWNASAVGRNLEGPAGVSERGTKVTAVAESRVVSPEVVGAFELAAAG